LAGANNRNCLIGGEMRQHFFERGSEIREQSARSEPQDGLAKTIDSVRGLFECFRSRVIGAACDNDLYGMM
jgi:hypothetical protein